MARRGHEGPMEFEWQNAPPADVTSPFYQLTVKHQEEQRRLYGTKRPHSVFESPSKPAAMESSFPAQPFVFSPPSPVRRFLGQHNPSFTTPRKMDPDPISSGGELSSPDNGHADAEDTPDRDRPTATPSMALVRTEQESPPSGNDDSVDDNPGLPPQSQPPPFSGRSNAAPIPTSPGRGEVRRPRFTDAITRRIHKRRRQEFGITGGVRSDHRPGNAPRHHHLRRSSHEDSESDSPFLQGPLITHPARSEHPHPPSQPQQPQQQPPQATITAILSWVESHPHLPHVLSFYAQLLLNLFLVFGFIYIAWSFWSTVRSDVDKHSESVASEKLAEIAACAQQYVANRCEASTRVPAMEAVCGNWERCMNQDPNKVGRARVSAHTFAEIFNSFVEPISYKAMIFTFILVFSSIAISNFAFGLFRAKTAPVSTHPMAPPPTPSQHHQLFTSPTPSHHMQLQSQGHGLGGGGGMVGPPPLFQLQQQHHQGGYGFGYGNGYGHGHVPFTPSRHTGLGAGGGGGGNSAWTEPRPRHHHHRRDEFS